MTYNFAIAPWNDIAPDAAWRSLVWSDPKSWWGWHGGFARLHPIFSLPYLSVLNMSADVMHIVCLGVGQHILGNVLYALCFDDTYMPGLGSPEERCEEVWSRIVYQYRINRVETQLGQLKLSFFSNDKSPASDNPLLTCKAAECRHLVPVLLAIWGGVCDRSSHHDDDVFVMLESLASFYDAMNANSYFLPEPVQRKVLDCVNEISIRYRHRSAEARLLEQNRWREVPKFHYVWHIALQTASRNPRWSWCYPDEDFYAPSKPLG